MTSIGNGNNQPWWLDDPHIKWYDQVMDNVYDQYQYAQHDILNYGFNEGSKSADTNRRALEAFKDMLPDLDQAAGRGDADGLVSRDDIQAALDDTSGKFSEEDKAVLKYMLNVKMNDTEHSTLFDELDGHDGKVSEADIDEGLTRDLDPDADTMKEDNGLVH